MTAAIELACQPKLPEKECNICGKSFTPNNNGQTMCQECRDYIKGGRYYKAARVITDVTQHENAIRARFEEKERNCTIRGEGYAERQIRDSLRKAGKVKTEL